MVLQVHLSSFICSVSLNCLKALLFLQSSKNQWLMKADFRKNLSIALCYYTYINTKLQIWIEYYGFLETYNIRDYTICMSKNVCIYSSICIIQYVDRVDGYRSLGKNIFLPLTTKTCSFREISPDTFDSIQIRYH